MRRASRERITGKEERELSILPRLAALLIVAGRARGQVTQLVSVSSSGIQGNSDSIPTGITPDGRFVVFDSFAQNLVAVDINGRQDVFVRDRELGVTELVSVGTSGVQGNDTSWGGWISADGRLVVFTSYATNLVAGDTNGFSDAFFRDRYLGTTERIGVGPLGVQANSGAIAGPISADGRFVILESSSTNLTAVPTSGSQVFMRDLGTLTNELVSVSTGGVQGDGPSYWARISADGRYVSLLSWATNLVRGDSNGILDVLLRDRLLGATERINVSTGSAEANAGGSEMDAWVSDDGNAVAFTSDATNLVAGDTNGVYDVFVRDRGLGTTVRVSVDSQGVQGDNRSTGAAISGDGNHVVFSSWATNLVPKDTNGWGDSFLHDRRLATTERVSVGAGGTEENLASWTYAEVSTDGRFVAFGSLATNLVPTDTNPKLFVDSFVRDRTGGTSFTVLCEPGTRGVASCPCGNPPSGPERGCDNSSATGGAVLAASGGTFLSCDNLVFTTSGERSAPLSILMQGNGVIPNGVVYGQGVRCLGGAIIRRLFITQASGGSVRVPDFGLGDPTVSGRSAAKGDLIHAGQSRAYLVYYRDPIVLGACPSGSTFNTTQTVRIDWNP